MVTNQGPDKGEWGEWGQCPRTALLVKRRNSKWSFTNEPEVSFRFRFYILIKVGPTVRPGLAGIVPVSRPGQQNVPEFHFSEFSKVTPA